MKKLIDNDVHLLWHIYPTKEVAKKYKKDTKFKDITAELNSWESENIDEYITSLAHLKLGNFLCENLLSHYEINNNKGSNFYLLLALQNNEIVGVIILNNNSQNITTDFKLDNNENNLRIEYIIVNPNKQNMGIGSRMIKSIINNQDTLSSNKPTNGIVSDIDNENIPSQHAFLKNHFKIVMPSSYLCRYFSRYYYTTRNPNRNNEL